MLSAKLIDPPAPSRSGPIERIKFRDLEFARFPIETRSSRGTPFTRWIPFGMPRLPSKALDVVCYLYPDEEAARIGQEFGGTAFVTAVPSRFAGLAYFYAVTNWHVACDRAASVLRVNTLDGGSDIFAFGPEDWSFDPRFDIAVCPLQLDRKHHRVAAIPTNVFVLREIIEQKNLGPGEDVFMVGRFLDHDGGPTNRPAVRFGNISVMPSPIEQPNGKMADSYCIDLHSRSGYSGSPVLVYRTPGYDLEERPAAELDQANILLAGTNYLGLLGIHFAQFPEKWELVAGLSEATADVHDVPLIREGAYVKGLSGMTCVLPAWHILDVLNLPSLKQSRDRGDAKEAERREREGLPPEAEGESTTEQG